MNEHAMAMLAAPGSFGEQVRHMPCSPNLGAATRCAMLLSHATHTRLTAGMFNCLTTQSLVFAERVVFYRERVGSARTAVAQCGRGGAGRAGWGGGCGLSIWANLGAWGCTGGVQALRSASVWAPPWAATAIMVSSAEEPLLTKCGVVLEPTSALQQVHSTHPTPTPNQPPAQHITPARPRPLRCTHQAHTT